MRPRKSPRRPSATGTAAGPPWSPRRSCCRDATRPEGGPLPPAGLGMSCLIPLIRAGFVDWIVSTGANLYHDTHYALDLPLHQGRPNLDDLALRQHDIIRIYDIVFDYATLLDTDAFYRELIQSETFARRMGTAEFHYEVGRYLHGRAGALGRPANSLLAAAYEAAVPIYTSSP